MSRYLEGKVAVVTGAGSGMGRAMSLLFASEGATVLGADVDQKRIDAVTEEVTKAGGSMAGRVVDVAQRVEVEGMIQLAVDELGGLDVLGNNAGVMDNFQGVETLDDGTYERLMAINVYGPMAAMRVAVPYMKAHGGGSIINTASAAGVGGGSAGAAYTASKHALIGLTRNTAVTYAKVGVRTNAIVAGAVATNIGSTFDPAKIDQEAMAVYSSWHPLAPATLEAEDIAQLALFLASDASKLINGACIAADAGWTAF